MVTFGEMMAWTDGWSLGGLLWAFAALWGIVYVIVKSEEAFGYDTFND